MLTAVVTARLQVKAAFDRRRMTTRLPIERSHYEVIKHVDHPDYARSVVVIYDHLLRYSLLWLHHEQVTDHPKPSPRPAQPALMPRVVDISPGDAEGMLARNHDNRPLDKGRVAQLREAIKRGEWLVTHQGIAFAGAMSDSRLLDGQHRLEAIRQSGRTVPMLVFEHVPPETFCVMDTGRARTASTVLAMQGEHDSSLLAATIRHIHLFQSMPDLEWKGQRSRLTNSQVLTFLEKNRDKVTEACGIARAMSKDRLIIPTSAAVGYYATREASPSVDQKAWVHGVTTGANLSPGDPRLALRNALISLGTGSSGRRRSDSRGQLGLYLKAWNAWVLQKPVKQLRFQRGERMPKPVHVLSVAARE
jgi:anti-sigma28 factor (negative regulator of flagellin synthesis)